MTETAVDRIRYKKFWSSFSNVCDNTAMMLNSSADDFEEEEREYILSCLPDLHGKDVVDIGAGIGRFTTMFARAARHVLSCDFMASFMRKNQERNEHFSNITYQVIDAVHLKLKPNSVDLVFTNWLLMYLNDEEVIEFLLNVLGSIRPNGFLHLRESCSQPSTAHANSTMHTTTETNPTSYRHVSEYIRLLKSVRCRQSDGKVYRFEVHWACSVPTYIMRQNNWRQIHWLTQKVLCEEDVSDEFDRCDALMNFRITTKLEQMKWNQLLEGRNYCWTDKVLSYVLQKESIKPKSAIMLFNPRQMAFHVHLNAFLISEVLDCQIVWSVETNELFYHISLAKVNQVKDPRLRVAWNRHLDSAIDYWMDSGSRFDAFVATEFFAHQSSIAPNFQQTVDKLNNILMPNAPVVLLEPFDEFDFDEEHTKSMLSQLQEVCIEDVTTLCNTAIREYFHDKKSDIETQPKVWKLIRAKAQQL